MDNNEQIAYIIVTYMKGEITPEQKLILDEWVNASDENRKVFSRLTDGEYVSNQLNLFYSFDTKTSWIKLQDSSRQTTTPIKRANNQIWSKLAVAAAFIGCVLGVYYIYNNHKTISQPQKLASRIDVKSPTLSKAYIKMDNGRIVILDSIKVNKIFKLNGIDVIKDDKGQIVYVGNTNKTSTNTLYNPRGSNIVTIVLSDGTKVWLNSESSISYPVKFNGDTRNVSITGEAYFEVVKSRTKRFVVSTENGVRTEVFGTHFDIKNYENDVCKITLLEGSVRVSNAENSAMLSPEQEAVQKKNTNTFLVKKANIDKVIAWKTGVFHFEDDNIYTVTKELSRWYDIDIKINGTFSSETYSGIINHNLSLMQVLQILKLAGVSYELKEKTLFINKL